MSINIFKSKLPAEYQEVEYIQSSGTQYIDTNYIPNQDTVVNCHINMISYNANDVFFGQRVAYMDNQYEFVAFNSQYVPQLRYNNQTTGAIQGSILSIGDHYIETSKNGLFIDNSRVGNTLNADTFTCQYSIYLFARNNAGTASAFSNIKLYSLKISENNILVRDFIPCYRKSDNVAGMYDTTSKNIFDYNSQVWTTGILYASGVINNGNTNYKTTDFIDILEAGKTYSIGFNQVYESTSGTSNRIAFYDEDKNFISWENSWDTKYINTQRYTRTITVPVGTKYIRYSVRNTDENVQIELGDTATAYKPFPFYINAGTGSFTKGNNVENYIVERKKASSFNGSRLPSEYQEIKYVQSSGTQYIDTGIKLSNTDVVKCKFEIILKPTDYSYREGIYGTMESISNTNTFFTLLMRSPSLARVGTSSNQVTSNNVELNTIYDTTLSNGTYIENDTIYTFIPNSGFTFTTNCYLFKRNQASMLPTHAKVYSFEIVGKFKGIPCYRKSDNEVGLYDTISGTFYTNIGTGSFTAGPVVNLPVEYQRVQYIESTGTQYIDTGTYPHQIGKWELDIQYTDASPANQTNGCFPVANQRFDIGTTSASKWTLNMGALNTYTDANNERHLFILDKINNKVSIDSTEYSVTATTFTSQTTYSVLIGARNYYGSSSKYNCNEKIYSSKIYDTNGVLIRNFVPCYNKSSGTIGLYDLVNGVFYTNSGTGDFVSGDDVSDLELKRFKPVILSKTNNLLNVNRSEWSITTKNPTDTVDFDYTKIYYMASSGYIRIPGISDVRINRSDGSISFSATNSSWWGVGLPIEVKPNTKYTISCSRLDGNKTKIMYALYNSDGSFGSYEQLTTNTSILDITKTITTGANVKTMVIVVAGITQDDTVYAYDIQVEEGQTATTFKPYGYEIIKI